MLYSLGPLKTDVLWNFKKLDWPIIVAITLEKMNSLEFMFKHMQIDISYNNNIKNNSIPQCYIYLFQFYARYILYSICIGQHYCFSLKRDPTFKIDFNGFTSSLSIPYIFLFLFLFGIISSTFSLMLTLFFILLAGPKFWGTHGIVLPTIFVTSAIVFNGTSPSFSCTRGSCLASACSCLPRKLVNENHNAQVDMRLEQNDSNDLSFCMIKTAKLRQTINPKNPRVTVLSTNVEQLFLIKFIRLWIGVDGICFVIYDSRTEEG